MLDNSEREASLDDAVLAPLAIAQVVFNLIADLNVSSVEKEMALELAKKMIACPRRQLMTVTGYWSMVSSGVPILNQNMKDKTYTLGEKDQKG